MLNLNEKYNYPAPRYTSFPPVPFWNGNITWDLWANSLQESSAYGEGVDLYIHIPFCESLCYYCGCHRFIYKAKSKASERSERYVSALLKEWHLYTQKLSGIKINSIHLGGGTPTFLTPHSLKMLLAGLFPFFNEGLIGSVEVDPRTCLDEHIALFKDYGLSRVSLGIQDFDERVQKAINRVQPFDQVKKLVHKLRKGKMTSLNFDLIYGLPLQTKKSIEETALKVNSLGPDLMAFYSYAHLPEKIKNQKLIVPEQLPRGDEKRALYEAGRQFFEKYQYVEIGLDHFARKESYLYKVHQKGELLRNFMGHTDKKSALLIGLGVSAISCSEKFFAQNTKDLAPYYASLEAQKSPLRGGHQLSESDNQIGEIIQDLICTGKTSLAPLAHQGCWSKIEKAYLGMQEDGLLFFSKESLRVTDLGRTYLRAIAMVLDPYISLTDAKFSQVL